MKVGTKSVLFGSHCFFIHPWFVALAWWRLFGFPWDPRLWVAFFVHDLGYWGMPNMDGKEGEQYPWFGAWVMSVFDSRSRVATYEYRELLHAATGVPWRVYPEELASLRCEGWKIVTVEKTFTLIERPVLSRHWENFSRYHSRFLAKRDGKPFSRLCVADKLAIVLTPTWLYVPMAIATGEIHEYRSLAETMNPGTPAGVATSHWQWHKGIKDYVRRWVEEHEDGREDQWTTVRHEREANRG